MVTKARSKCVICDVKPSQTEKGYCHNCNAKIEAMKSNRKPEAHRYITFKGVVIGCFPKGKPTKDTPQMYDAVKLHVDPDRLPKRKTINLNTYCEGYTRDQVKKFKRVIARMS